MSMSLLVLFVFYTTPLSRVVFNDDDKQALTKAVREDVTIRILLLILALARTTFLWRVDDSSAGKEGGMRHVARHWQVPGADRWRRVVVCLVVLLLINVKNICDCTLNEIVTYISTS